MIRSTRSKYVGYNNKNPSASSRWATITTESSSGTKMMMRIMPLLKQQQPQTSLITQRFASNVLRKHQIPAVFSCLWIVSYNHYMDHRRSYCSTDGIILPANDDGSVEVKSRLEEKTAMNAKKTSSSLRQRVHRYWRMMKRMVKLVVTLSPIVLFYPIALLSSNMDKPPKDAHVMANALLGDDDKERLEKGFIGWYYRLCLSCVERSGACVIKLMQWAGSRPDLFGNDFCAIFSKLQDNTQPHSWKHTTKLMQQAYGANWNDTIRIPQQQKSLLGSGCIGQVYHGNVKLKDGSWKDVAIKVLHPSVEDDIDADLDLMRSSVQYLDYLTLLIPSIGKLKWLNLAGIVDELARLLQLQMDLRNEAKNLQRFHHNFQDNQYIQFPAVIEEYAPSQHVLVEEYCTGIPIVQFCRTNFHTNPEVLSNLCQIAIKAVCQMIFLDNFVHGDLHPGNVFVSPDGKKFILFDVGIVNEYSDADHQLIVDVLASFVRKDGRKAGRLMIDDSNIKLLSSDREDYAIDEEKYIDKIEELTIRASTKGYLMEHLGTYITHICDAASQHHVMMNPAFISAALAVKVQEGIALAMDPSVKIPNIAIPIIIKSEARRKVQSNKSDLLTSLQQFMDTIFLTSSSRGDKNNNATTTAPTTTPSPTTNSNSQNRGKAAASQGQAA